MNKWVFVGAFIISFGIQGLLWSHSWPLDETMWANQGYYVQVSDAREFDAAAAYGHPGGPVIISTILTHHYGQVTYKDAVLFTLTLIDSILIAGIVTVCYALRKNLWWCAIILATLPIHRLYVDTSTPPSIVASLGVALLAFYTWYLYERNLKSVAPLALWGVIAGFTIATRLDIGGVSTFVFLMLLLTKYRVRTLLGMIAVAFGAFAFFDPFMWFMPVQHMIDLVTKMFVHYDGQQVVGQLPLSTVIDISLISSISVLCASAFIFLKNKLTLPVDRRWLYAVMGLTVIWYGIILTAQFQAVRYFLPILMIWEVLLPLFMFTLSQHIKFSSAKTEKGQKYVRWGIMLFLLIILSSYQFLARYA